MWARISRRRRRAEAAGQDRMFDLEPLEWHRVASLEDLPADGVRRVAVGLRRFALVRCEGRYSILDDECPHQGASLGVGCLEDGSLVCPSHGWAFDPRTGEGRGPFAPVGVHPCEVREDGIYIGLARGGRR
jgi:nitrite reductase/ring-hydroxylating ferredoxin subunit